MKSKTSSPFELPADRLASTTETGSRVYIYPPDFKGKFRTLRTWVYALLVVIFLGLPWIKYNHQPFVLLDLVKRHFIFFGVPFWADEAPLLFLVFISAILAIASITAIWGRLWCGWACPQTVFIDLFYRRIERWIEGSPQQRRLLDKSPFSAKTLSKRAVKYSLFFLISTAFAHSFAAYFVGSEALIRMMQSSPFLHPKVAGLVAFITLLLVFDFGWFREQFCIIACPYGRLQSVLLDQQSMIVGYHATRGEPRKKEAQDTDFSGDCINCYRCVQVCPTGVDIRRGLQMECIMCTACIDACDEVMGKIQKPKGLISYTSEVELAGKRVAPLWKRTRIWVYSGLLLLAFSSLVYLLSQREPIRIFAVRGASGFEIISDTEVVNHFKIHVYNHTADEGVLTFSLAPESIQNKVSLILPTSTSALPQGKNTQVTVFVKAPISLFKKGQLTQPIHYKINFHYSKSLEGEYSLKLVGPER